MRTKLEISTKQPSIEDLKLLSVKISKRVSDDELELLGTGTIVCNGEDFYVLTAAHCFRDKDGNQKCSENEIVLTLYDENYNPTNIGVKSLELSDIEKDTAIITIKTPPGGYGYYFHSLKLLGKELDGFGYVFGYTEKKQYGWMFTYKRVNTHLWANQDGITEKGIDFFRTVKGSSGGGMLVRVNDVIYCMGFVKSTFDKESTLDDVIIQPITLYKTQLGGAFFSSIEDAIGAHRYDSSDGKLQQEYCVVWRKIYDIIFNNGDLRDTLSRLNDIRKQCTIPKNINPQNDVVSLLFRRREPWTEDCQEVFLMALEDQGMWISIFGDQIPDVAKGMVDRPLAKKLEVRADTLTKAPYNDVDGINIVDDQSYYEQMLRYAFQLDFTNLKKMVFEWKAKGFWTARKALFMNLFKKDVESLAELNEYLKDTEDNVPNEQFIATAVYNVVNDDFTDRKPYERFLNAGLDGISSILSYIADHIGKRDEKVTVYGLHQKYLFGGEDTKSLPEALRLLRSIIDAGILTNFKFTYFVSPTNWLKVVRYLFRNMPYPILFYTLLYTDEKLQRRVGQEYAYTDDEEVVKELPEILQRLLKAIGNENTPKIYIGLYILSSELYVAVNEDFWYDLFRDNVLRLFCSEPVVKNVSHSDTIYINVKEAIRHTRSVERRIELFKILTTALPYNAYLINEMIHDFLMVDEALMMSEAFQNALTDVIKKNSIRTTYMIASKFGRQEWAGEELKVLIDEVVKRDGLDFGSETTNAIGMLSGVIRNESTKAQIKAILLSKDMWNCGITDAHYTEPNPIRLERVDETFGWTKEDWAIIKENMLKNIAMIGGDRSKNKDVYNHFGSQYIGLLSNMKYFIKKNIEKVDGCEVDDVNARIDQLLQELRQHKNVAAELSSDDYDTVVEGVWNLRDRYEYEGLESCKQNIQLLINRVLLQTPTALESCISLLSAMVADKPEEMTNTFRDSLLEVVKKYVDEFDYETLFVNVPNMYMWLREIAKGLSSAGVDAQAVKYWLEDPMVNRFNFVE